ncbi:MAG TPA: hypothetical protein PKI32_02540 [Opitutales bacterium]|nr:hypothetical protein [Opitutales bacterium]
MKIDKLAFLSLFVALGLLSACSSVTEPTDFPNETATGQLSPRKVLGMAPFSHIDARDVRAELPHRRKFALREGGLVLVLQSGLEAPEKSFLSAMAQHCAAIPFSGVPSTLYTYLRMAPEDLNYNYDDIGTGGSNVTTQWSVMSDKGAGASFTRMDLALRKAAEDTGAETIVILWNKPAPRGVPAFRAAVMDVKSGRWEIVSPYSPGGALEGSGAPQDDASRAAAFKALADILFAQPRA